MKISQKTAIMFFSVLFFFTMLTCHTVHAEGEYELLERIPGIGQTADFPTYMQGLYNFAVGFVAVAALFMVSIGGFYYIASAGNQAQATTAKKIITDALLGLIVVFLTYTILNVINPTLLNSSPSLKSLQNSAKMTQPFHSTLNSSRNFSVRHSDSHVNQSVSDSQVQCDNGRCYKSKSECIANNGESGENVCKPAREAFEDSLKFYTQDGNGKHTEYESEAACKDAGNDNCVSAKMMKAQSFRNTKTEEEIKNEVGNITDEAAKKADAYASDKTIEHMKNITNKLGNGVIDTDSNGASYKAGDKYGDNKSAITALEKYAGENNVKIEKKKSSSCNFDTCKTEYKIEFPADYNDESLAGTTMVYSITDVRHAGKVYGNIVVTAAQSISKDE